MSPVASARTTNNQGAVTRTAACCGSLFGAAAALIAAGYVLSWSFEPVRLYLRARWFPDDAFYYFEIARNIATGWGFTFDRINPTNGFQPLWQMICAATWLAAPEPESFLRAINIVQAALLGASFLALFRATQVLVFSPLLSASALVLALFFFPFFYQFVNGLETGVYLTATACVLLAALRIQRGQDKPRDHLALAAALTGMFFARLDSGVLVAMLALWLLARRTPMRRLALAIAPVAVLGACYLAVNYAAFGEFMPISGAVKREWGRIALTQAQAGGKSLLELYAPALIWPLQHADHRTIMLLVAVNVVLAAVYAASRQPVLLAFQLFLVCKYVLYVLLFYTYAIFQWYYAIDWVGPLIGLPFLAARALRGVRWPGWLAWSTRAVGVAVLAVLIYSQLTRNFWSVQVQLGHQRNMLRLAPEPGQELDLYYAAAAVIRDLGVPEDAVLSAHNAGVLAFFLDQRVVNIDGLVNSRRRLEFIRRHGWDFLPYLDEAQPVDGYVDTIPHPAWPDFQKSFVRERGFVSVPLREMVDKRFGAAPTNGLLLFLKPNIAERLSIRAAP